jgi:hypothetical protein
MSDHVCDDGIVCAAEIDAAVERHSARIARALDAMSLDELRVLVAEIESELAATPPRSERLRD